MFAKHYEMRDEDEFFNVDIKHHQYHHHHHHYQQQLIARFGDNYMHSVATQGILCIPCEATNSCVHILVRSQAIRDWGRFYWVSK